MRPRAGLQAIGEATWIAQAGVDSTANVPVYLGLLDEMLKTIFAEAQASVPSGL